MEQHKAFLQKQHLYRFLILTLLFIPFRLYTQDLSIFDKFIGQEWIGHYQNSDDSALVHCIQWSYDFDKNVVKETKHLPELDFRMETYYYPDFTNNQISYISFANKAIYSTGKVTEVENKLELSGKTFFQNGMQENKKSYEITKDGMLKDIFLRKSRDAWVQGHYILYRKK